MHVELADLFRCPEPHADSWLVLASDHTERRVVLAGTLGCPVCGAEYRIVDGVTLFGGSGAPVHARDGDAHAVYAQLSDDQAMRAAALLNATDANATLGFVGESLAMVRAVQGVVGARCVAFDAPDAIDARRWYAANDAPLAVVHTGGRSVLAPGALSGLWIAADATHPNGQPRTRGRLVAPATQEVPVGFTELARDATQWVAERDADSVAGAVSPSALTQLRRRR